MGKIPHTECTYNPNVICDEKNRCGSCGWNPKVEKKRKGEEEEDGDK